MRLLAQVPTWTGTSNPEKRTGGLRKLRQAAVPSDCVSSPHYAAGYFFFAAFLTVFFAGAFAAAFFFVAMCVSPLSLRRCFTDEA